MGKKYEYQGCTCSTERADLTGGDARLIVHCIRLNDYRSFADAGAAGANLDPKMAELYRSQHGGIPQYQYDAARSASNPVGTPQVQRLLSAKGRAPDAAQWVTNYMTERTAGKTIPESIAVADAKAAEGVLQGSHKKTASTVPTVPVLDAQGNVVVPPPEAPRHHAARFIGIVERAHAAVLKVKEGFQELHRLNPPVTGTPEAKQLFADMADCVIDSDELLATLQGFDALLKATPDTLNVEAPKIEPKAGGWCLVREKFHAEISEQLGCEPTAMTDLRLLILSVSGNGVVCCDPEYPTEKVFAPSTSLLVVAEPDPASIVKADECRAVKRARRA